MITFDTIQQAIVDSTTKHISWLFDIVHWTNGGAVYFWSTKAKTFQDRVIIDSMTHNYSFKILPNSFSGITLNRAKPELGVQTPNEITFQVINTNNVLTASNFINGTVYIRLIGSKYTPSELLTNTGFETYVGTRYDGIDDSFTGYTIAGDGIVDSTGTFHSGTNAIKIIAGAAIDKRIMQTVTVTAQEHYSFSFWSKTGFTVYERYRIYDVTNSADIIPLTTGTSTSTSWVYQKINFTTPAGCTSIRLELYCPSVDGTYAYYDDVSLTYTEIELCVWPFSITRCESGYQVLTFTCEDFLQRYIKGDYPKKGLVKNLFKSNSNLISDSYCLPEPFGTAYIPLRLIIKSSGNDYYLLGPTTNTAGAAVTYNINKQRVPRGAQVGKYEWESPAYTFTQSTLVDDTSTNRRVFTNNINDGLYNQFYANGDHWFDVPTEFTRSDRTSTDPADIIGDISIDLRGPIYSSNLISSASLATAGVTYTTWGLVWNGGLYNAEPAEKIIGKLLNMCHSTIISNGIQTDLKILYKTSQKTITKAEVLKTSDQGYGTFKYSAITKDIYDSGYVAYQELGEAQDEFIQILVPTKQGGTTANPSSEILELPFIGDSVTAQKLGILYYQRKYLKIADISFSTKSSCLALRPDDVITINHTDYGGNYDVLIESISIKKDLTLEFHCIQFSEALDDYTDLSPTAITLTTAPILQTSTRNYAATYQRAMELFTL